MRAQSNKLMKYLDQFLRPWQVPASGRSGLLAKNNTEMKSATWGHNYSNYG